MLEVAGGEKFGGLQATAQGASCVNVGSELLDSVSDLHPSQLLALHLEDGGVVLGSRRKSLIDACLPATADPAGARQLGDQTGVEDRLRPLGGK